MAREQYPLKYIQIGCFPIVSIVSIRLHHHSYIYICGKWCSACGHGKSSFFVELHWILFLFLFSIHWTFNSSKCTTKKKKTSKLICLGIAFAGLKSTKHFCMVFSRIFFHKVSGKVYPIIVVNLVKRLPSILNIIRQCRIQPRYLLRWFRFHCSI